MEKFFRNPVLKTRITSSSVKLQEMFIGYLLAPLCAMIANSIFSAYLTRYYADVLGLTDSQFGVFSMLLPIISAIVVVAGNLFVGQLIDNTRTPAGKARPYLLLSAPVMAVAIILLFMTPGGDNPQAENYMMKMVWIAVSFNLFYSIGYPCYYTAHSSMVALSTRNGNQRGLLATLSNASMIAAAGVGASILVPVLLQPFMFVTGADGTIDRVASYANWRILGIAMAVLTAFGIILEYYFTRERITEESIELGVKEEKLPMKTHVKACTSEKYWWMVILFILFFQMGQLVKNTSMSFYARWMFDSVLASSSPENTSGALMSTLGLIGGLPSAVGMVIAWPLASKLGKKKAIVLGLIFSLAGGLVAFINVHSFGIVCAGVVLKAIGIIPAQYVMVAVLSDVLDHLEAKHGFRSDGFTMSIYGATMVGLAVLSMGIVNIFLSAMGYDATVTKQAASTETGMVIAYLCMDMIGFALSIVLLWRMDVEKYTDEDRKKVLERQKAAVLAEGGTWIEPEERARLEQEEADRKAEEERIAELKKRCREKGLNFEAENRKYLEKQEKRKNSLIGKLLG
ncbi:MAG TPA: MFS transporter [Lachnospiraceae bacterium]|nr:MFS transporter [Lachnospiraceae bacterium]